MPNCHELCIELLTLDLLDRERDVATYRELLQIVLGQFHEAHAEATKMRAQHQRLRDEYRALRIQTMREAAA